MPESCLKLRNGLLEKHNSMSWHREHVVSGYSRTSNHGRAQRWQCKDLAKNSKTTVATFQLDGVKSLGCLFPPLSSTSGVPHLCSYVWQNYKGTGMLGSRCCLRRQEAMCLWK